jgi:hypothetical protein
VTACVVEGLASEVVEAGTLLEMGMVVDTVVWEMTDPVTVVEIATIAVPVT